MVDSGDRKAALRARLRDRRDATSIADRAMWSQQLAAHGSAALAAQVGGRIVSLYWPMRSEADPRPLATALADAGAVLALPAFVGARMEFRRWLEADELRPAGFQTFEPLPSAPVVVPAIVLAPLLGFDPHGGRLGWGKGYYDTYLGVLDAAGPRPFVVGVAFACQEAEAVPLEPHDRRLDAVVTERGYRRC